MDARVGDERRADGRMHPLRDDGVDARELHVGRRVLREQCLPLAHHLARDGAADGLGARARGALLVADAHSDDREVCVRVGLLLRLVAEQRDDAVGRGRAEDDLARLREDGVEVEDRAERVRHLVEQGENARLAAQLFQLRVHGVGEGALGRGGDGGALLIRAERGADHVVGRDEELRPAERLVLEARLGRLPALVGEVEAQAARSDLNGVAVVQRVFELLLAVDEDVVGRGLAVETPVEEDVGAVPKLDVRVVARRARVV